MLGQAGGASLGGGLHRAARGAAPSARAAGRKRVLRQCPTAQSAATAAGTTTEEDVAATDLGAAMPVPAVPLQLSTPEPQQVPVELAASPAARPAEEGEADAAEPAAQPPVALSVARTLPPQSSLAAALAALRSAVSEVPSWAGAYASGLVRLEVPLPHGTRALWWLRGQAGPTGEGNSDGTPVSARLYPRIYFSPRRTTAADTEGSAAAGSASAGAGSVAGMGAAWLWRGAPGQALGEATVRAMQRFLAGAASAPRVRAFGGARFNAAQQPSGEWAEFGSFCFMIPRVEFLEASGCSLLACTVAWDASYDAAPTGSRTSPGTVGGFASVEAAATDALAALAALQPAAAPAAGAFKLQRHAARHVPDEAGWRQLMDGTHAELAAAATAAAAAAATQADQQGDGQLDACTPMLKICPDTAREEYLLNGQEGLDDLLAALDGGFEATTMPQDGGLTKVVLARRTDVAISGQLDPLALLEALGERDPRAYQILLQMPSGATFLGSTPECLYTRTGSSVASEAVAGTRARGAGGDVEQDFWLAFDLLRSHKDHVEFTVVRDWVQQALSGVCERVQVDVAKSVLKQGAVQHLYGKLSAQLKPGSSDAHLLAALHPTPAVCGRPREDALGLLADSEPFDRGFYAGPFGWIGQEAAEFVVAIRSALVQPPGAPHAQAAQDAAQAVDGEQLLRARLASHAAAGPGPQSAGSTTAGSSNGAAAVAAQPSTETTSSSSNSDTLVSLYAGVGIVRGSDTASEWAELDLKVRQYERLLQGVPPLAAAPNINALWARLMVEELCRLGCNTFCVAPGSRSSPLTVAIAQHPRARIVPCIDERSLGFWALGYGRATGRPAVVVTSSGTAVANLLPSVVEASQSGVPLLLLTGDRPAELRDTGANQTIDQVKMFGTFTRWHADLPAPVDALPARTVLSAVDTAVQHATGVSSGPVHINCQFREPLAPVEAGSWDRHACLQGLQHWERGDAPFTAVTPLQAPAGTAVPLQLQPALPGMGSSLVGAASLAANPAAQAALQAIGSARRGLIVASELTNPADVVAAAQLAQLLGWPMVADVLSGLRAGVRASPAEGAAAAAAAADGPAMIHHFDQLLLLDRQQWQALRPDVVLQLGGHLTSKRTGQFLEWCCLAGQGAGGSSSGQQQQQQHSAASAGEGPPALQWILVDRSPKRHDQFHLLSHRLQAPLPLLVGQLAAEAAAAAQQSGALAGGASAGTLQAQEQQRYRCLLQALDREASAAVDAALAAMPELTEPAVARALSRQLPPGEGLFVGNSMPIRDLDMYAAPARPAAPAAVLDPTAVAAATGGAGSSAMQAPQGVVASALGAPVGANRGASGIDGVLSTAAGFADGLGRGATLVVGDLSFLHDINGLNLLRSGEARPPLTVVLINNSGGGIFSFLPIADALPEDVFTPLWATPQHVDLEGMCRAHGIPHQKVTAAEDLGTALRSAWGCNRHSVIEVVTSRVTNVDRHREIQAAVKRAVSRTLRLLEGGPQQAQQEPSAAAAVGSLGPLLQQPPLMPAPGTKGCGPFDLAVQAASYHAFSLPLAQPLTTAGAAGAGDPHRRQGFLLRLSLAAPSGSSWVHGVGEVAPLPGLHRETLQEAEQQLALLCQLLGSGGGSGAVGASSSGSNGTYDGASSALPQSATCIRVPLSAALLGSRLSDWLQHGLGVTPASLLPSVRCGLEAALLSALAQHRGMSLAQLLSESLHCEQAPQPAEAVAVNGLLDCQGSPEEAAAEAAALLHRQPFAALKIKVGRRADPAEDAAAVLAVRRAVGPGVVLRADANRRWTLEQAVQFGRAVAPAQLQYVEEPVGCTAELAEVYRRTGLPLALDETVDEGLVGPGAPDGGDALCEGVVALVLKPAVLGGFERTAELATWARQRGMLAVLSSSFETSLGTAQLAQLAAALEGPAGAAGTAGTAGTTQHGLATLSWFAEDLLPAAAAGAQQHLLQPLASSNGCTRSSHLGVGIGMAAAHAVVDSSTALALGLHARQPPQAQQAQRRRCTVETHSGSYEFSLLEVLPAAGSAELNASSNNGNSSSTNGSSSGGEGLAEPPPVLFLHGFLGGADDWLPLMAALGQERRCLAVDLPGHGSTTVATRSTDRSRHSSSSSSSVDDKGSGSDSSSTQAYSLEAAAEAVAALVEQHGLQGCQLVGYSLGARLALLLAARWPRLFTGVASISGTPGLPDPAARAERAARDDSLAAALSMGGLPSFLDHWYQLPMWVPLRASPRFTAMLAQRQHAGDAQQLAAVLAAASPGRAPSLWQELPAAVAAGSLPLLLLVAGQHDSKFVALSEKLGALLAPAGSDVGADCTRLAAQVAVVPGCGHAVHIERPLDLLVLLQQFFSREGRTEKGTSGNAEPDLPPSTS